MLDGCFLVPSALPCYNFDTWLAFWKHPGIGAAPLHFLPLCIWVHIDNKSIIIATILTIGANTIHVTASLNAPKVRCEPALCS